MDAPDGATMTLRPRYRKDKGKWTVSLLPSRLSAEDSTMPPLPAASGLQRWSPHQLACRACTRRCRI